MIREENLIKWNEYFWTCTRKERFCWGI